MPIHLEIQHLKEIRVKLLPDSGQKAGVFFNFLSEWAPPPKKYHCYQNGGGGGVPSFKRACLHW